MYKNKTVLSIYRNLNFITVVSLFLINKKKIQDIDSIYYLIYNYGISLPNSIRESGKHVKNYFLSLNYNFENLDNNISLNDKLLLLSHITLLRNITRKKKNSWYIILDNMMINNSNISYSLNSPILKLMKCFELVSYKSEDNNISFYIINKLCAKMMIFSYIMCINKLYT